MDNLDFESEFVSDTDVEEALEILTGIIDELSKNEGGRTSIMNPQKVQAVLYTYKVLRYLTKGTGAKVTYVLNEPYTSMGSVSICGKDITFSRPEWFMFAVKLASNFNIYPKTNGTVQMDFTFHGLTTTLE